MVNLQVNFKKIVNGIKLIGQNKFTQNNKLTILNLYFSISKQY